MTKGTDGSGSVRAQAERTEARAWTFSLLWAIGVVGLFILASATINPLFGQSVHWDWMAGIAPAEFVVLALALQRRWIEVDRRGGALKVILQPRGSTSSPRTSIEHPFRDG